MDETNEKVSLDVEALQVPESPKPMAFTIDFGEGKVDKQRHKFFIEKYQKRQQNFTVQKKERINKNVKLAHVKSRESLSLPLKNLLGDRMTQSCTLPSVSIPEIELRDALSPEMGAIPSSLKLVRHSSMECDNKKLEEDLFVDATEFNFDRSDNDSDTGTYTLDADNYSEEQKARMSIDSEFKIEQISVLRRTEDYIKSLNIPKQVKETSEVKTNEIETNTKEICAKEARVTEVKEKETVPIVKPQTLDLNSQRCNHFFDQKQRILSPILSPTQNMSITQNIKEAKDFNSDDDNKVFNKIMFPSPKSKTGIGSEPLVDHGNVISVTSSGAFRSRNDKNKRHVRHLSLSKSSVQVEAYTDNGFQNEVIIHTPSGPNLTASVVHVSDNLPKNLNEEHVRRSSCEFGTLAKLANLSGASSGKVSPTKIPSPIHAFRPRSRNSTGSTNIDLSDSSLETESYLKPTQNIINSLTQRLSLDSDRDLDNTKYLNNDARNLLKKPTHLRHNSFDDKNLKMSNKLEHFQSKNLQSIDQTYTNMLGQYKVNKIQNSPNNSPIRRSSSFSTKNQMNVVKNSNLQSKETNLINSPNISRTTSIQRSVSTASIKPNLLQARRSSVSSDHQKIDRTIFGDTESSSEEDFEKNFKKKDITNTRYNRAFSLRRARLEEPNLLPPPKCPNTPEMRRKFQPTESRQERAISVDRKSIKANDVQSRYLQNITKKHTPSMSVAVKPETPKNLPRAGSAGSKGIATKSQVFSRTDSGRFSMRTSRPPPANNTPKNLRKDSAVKNKSGGRSNSSLSSREVEFQNWKRRKSYDPMKAAAEGKRKADMAKRVSNMTQSYTDGNQDYDSSPSRSSSVHRSQSFHGTAALEQLISSDEDDQTLSADEGFSPPTPSPCELSPARASLKYAWREQIMME